MNEPPIEPSDFKEKMSGEFPEGFRGIIFKGFYDPPTRPDGSKIISKDEWNSLVENI